MRRIVIAAALVVLTTACGGASDDGTTTTTGQPTTTTAQTATTETPTTTTSTASTTSAAPGDVGATITIAGFSFGETVSIAAGEAVAVVNTDSVGHTWTSDEGAFSSGVIAPDQSYEYTFDSPGEYAFFCSIHPSMTGTITVTG